MYEASVGVDSDQKLSGVPQKPQKWRWQFCSVGEVYVRRMAKCDSSFMKACVVDWYQERGTFSQAERGVAWDLPIRLSA